MKTRTVVAMPFLWVSIASLFSPSLGCGSRDRRDDSTVVHAQPFVPSGQVLTTAGWLDVETEYIPGVVDCELAWFTSDLNALRAQAVAARTYLARQMELRPFLGGPDLPIDITPAFQCYRPATRTTAFQAAADTSGVTMTWGGMTISAHYDAGAQVDASGRALAPRAFGYPYDSWDALRTAWLGGVRFGGAAWTEIFVTHNEDKLGDRITRTIQTNTAVNRGAFGQHRAAYLGSHGYDFRRILRYFYGRDITVGEGVDLRPIGPPVP